MDKYLRHLYAAFLLVEERYYNTTAFDGDVLNENDEKVKEYRQYVERVFAYELYHQYRNIITNNAGLYSDLVLNAEIRKNGFSETLIGKNHIFPDMVLHKDQLTRDKKNQVLFIEIKTSQSFVVNSDVKKLITAVSGRLSYQNAVFICINSDGVEGRIKTCLNSNEILTSDEYKANANLLKQIWLITERGILNFSKIKNG